jgi:DNA-binding GntR family transcriptional regulator
MARRGRISLGEQVYRSLLRDLAAGVLVPTERLAEERLAEAYGVSRTPVREALARLLADGMLERRTDGLYPYRPRLDELGDLYELRIVLEARGIQRIHHGEPAAEPAGADPAEPAPTGSALPGAQPRGGLPATPSHDQLAVRRELDAWRRLRDDPPDTGTVLIAADEQFHTALLAAAGNSALADALATVHARIRPIRSLDPLTPARIATMTADHITIAEQILAGDLDAALVTLIGHIAHSRAHVLARAREALRLTRLGQALRD